MPADRDRAVSAVLWASLAAGENIASVLPASTYSVVSAAAWLFLGNCHLVADRRLDAPAVGLVHPHRRLVRAAFADTSKIIEFLDNKFTFNKEAFEKWDS